MFEYDGKKFDWDIEKNKININKHGISFKEASTVFSDPQAIEIEDYEHSINEDRFIIIGCSRRLKIITVCHCYRNKNTVIRIISAREANKEELEIYGGIK